MENTFMLDISSPAETYAGNVQPSHSDTSAVRQEKNPAITPASITPASGFPERTTDLSSRAALPLTRAPRATDASKPGTFQNTSTGSTSSPPASSTSSPWASYHIPPKDSQKCLDVINNYVQCESTKKADKGMLRRLETQQLHLVHDAHQDFPKLVKDMPRPRMPDIPVDASSERILTDILGNSKGLVLGEQRSSPACAKFLIDNMPALSRLGVKTLYSDHFTPEIAGESMKQFFSSKDTPMPEVLKQISSQRDKQYGLHKYSDIDVLNSAREHGIEVVPMDPLASRASILGIEKICLTPQGIKNPPNTKINGDSLTMLNQYAQTLINARQGATDSGKWVACVSAPHANTCEKTPGIAELTGAIGMKIEEDMFGREYFHANKLQESAEQAPKQMATMGSPVCDYVMGVALEVNAVDHADDVDDVNAGEVYRRLGH
jgi:hypothetical protein